MAVFQQEQKESKQNEAEYDAIADDYVNVFEKWPVSQYVALPMINLVGDVKGLRVLDLACGDGAYSRLYKKMGASEVVAVDLSEEMIKIARQKSSDITYYIGNATKLEDLNLGQFDVVCASFLLNYCTSVEMLKSMIKNIKSSFEA